MPGLRDIVNKEKNMPYQCLSNSLYSESVEFYKSLDKQSIPTELTRQSDQGNSLDRFVLGAQKSNDFICPIDGSEYKRGVNWNQPRPEIGKFIKYHN